MRTRLALTALAAVLLTSACGSGDAPAAEPSTSAPSSTAASQAPAPGADGRTTIYGSVGSQDNPESFDINFTDADGTSITELPAGDYQVKVTDNATIHNFHLTGPGVDEQTDVQGTDDETFDLTLEQGDYEYVCDPHVSSMSGSFTVT